MLYHHCFSTLLEYAIKRVQVNKDGLKLNGTHQLLVYADRVNVLSGKCTYYKSKTEALVVPNKENGLEANAVKTMYTVMSREQNARRSHIIKLIIVPLKGWNSSKIWEQP